LKKHLLGVVMREGHQGDKSLLFANLECLTKVFRLGPELVHTYRALGAEIELFLPVVDLIVDPLLIWMI
jgi:hypothetical protein